MAKLSSINKNERRKKLVAKTAAKYAKLKATANDKSVDETERLMARASRWPSCRATATRPGSATAAS